LGKWRMLDFRFWMMNVGLGRRKGEGDIFNF
jgi:hypothetical protein